MKVGYIPDPFGQIAHMPAILRGFGIENATMWRGADDSLKTTEFCWRIAGRQRGADDPQAEGLRRRSDAAAAAKGARHAHPGDPRRSWSRTPRRRTCCVMNGSDHLPPQPELSSMLRTANERARRRVSRVTARCPRSSTAIREYDRRPRAQSGRGTRASSAAAHARTCYRASSRRACGSSRRTRSARICSRTGRSRSPTWADILKRADGRRVERARCRRRRRTCLSRRQEASIAALIDRAWRHLLENQPHDSICGCSVDSVHEEMRQRYEWVKRDRRGDRATVAAHDRRARPERPARHDHRLQSDAAAGDRLRDRDGAVVAGSPGRRGDRPERRAHRRGAGRRHVETSSFRTAQLVGLRAHARRDRLRRARDVPGYGYKIVPPGRRRTPRAAERRAAAIARYGIDNEFFPVEVESRRTAR